MTHPNETMIRTAYDAVSTGDLEPMLGMLSEEIRWNVSGQSPLAGDYEGKHGVLQFVGPRPSSTTTPSTCRSGRFWPTITARLC